MANVLRDGCIDVCPLGRAVVRGGVVVVAGLLELLHGLREDGSRLLLGLADHLLVKILQVLLLRGPRGAARGASEPRRNASTPPGRPGSACWSRPTSA